MKKFFLVASTIALSAVMLIGCSNDKAATDADVSEVYIFGNNGAAGGGTLSNETDLNLVAEEIQNKTGIKPVLVASGSNASTEKLNVLLASDQRLDLFWGKWRTYAKDKIILPLNDYLKDAKNINSVTPKDAWAATTTDDGTIYGVPRIFPTASYPTFIRSDWLDKYGLSMPKTLEEMENVLKVFKEEDPTGNGGTIPLLIDAAGVKYGFSAAFTGTGYGTWLDDSDGKIKSTILHPEFRNALAKIAEWYKKGYINREAFSANQTQMREWIKQNKVGIHIGWYSNVTGFETTLRSNFPDAKYEIALWEGAAGKPETAVKTIPNAALIYKYSKNPEGVIKLIDWGYGDDENYFTLAKGVKGVHWDYVEGSKFSIKQTDEQKNKYVGEYNVALGPKEQYIAEQLVAEGGEALRDSDPQTYFVGKNLTDIDRTVKSYDFTFFSDDNQVKENVPSISDINRMIDEALLEFMTGARDISEYDSFLNDLKSLGYDSYTEEINRQYQNSLKK